MTHPTLQFKRAYLAMRRAIEKKIKPFHFSVAQFDVLQLLFHDDGLEHRELQKRLGIASPTLSNILDGMERDGHISRHGDLEDARVKRIYLGETARAICWSPEFCDASDELIARMFAGFTPQERDLCLQMFSRIEKNLDDPN
jgi:DNA-binding MarR family transcriptional regulator